MVQSGSPFNRSPFGKVGSIILTLLVIYLIFQVVGYAIDLIWWAAPIVFIASLVIDHKVFLGYLGQMKRLFQRNWMYALAAGVLSVILFPLLALYFLGMALFKKKVRERRQEMDERVNGRWTEYEEVKTEPMDLDIPYEELPPPPEPQTRRRGDDTKYDELFN